MFERYVVCEDGFQNTITQGEITGFQVKLRAPYYRGIALSLINSIDLEVDGIHYAREDMEFEVETGRFPYSALSTVVNNRWELGEKAVLYVAKSGGLSAGAHVVHAIVNLRISYQPHPNIGDDTKMLQLVEGGKRDE